MVAFSFIMWIYLNLCWSPVALRKLRSWQKTLESPLDCKEIQSVHFLKEISPEYTLDGLILKLKL